MNFHYLTIPTTREHIIKGVNYIHFRYLTHTQHIRKIVGHAIFKKVEDTI